MSKTVWTKPQVFDHGGDTSLPWFVFFRFTNPVTGQRKQFRFKKGINYFPTVEQRRKEANRLRKELTDLLQDGWNPFENEVHNPENLITVFKRMYDLKAASLRKESIRTYVYKVRHLTDWLSSTGYGDWLAGEFTTKQAYEYLDHCVTCGFKGHHFNIHRTIAKLLFEMMRARKLIKDNPFEETSRKKVDIGSSTVFTAEEVAKVRKHLSLKNKNLGVVCDYIYYTFLRPNECRQLRIKHFEFDRYRIIVPPEISKTGQTRIVQIPPALHWHIKKLREGETAYLHEFGSGKNYQDAFAFGFELRPHPEGYANRNSISEKFRLEVQIPLKLTPGHTIYVFKHTGVDAALKVGCSVPATMKQGGWRSIKSFQHYVRSLKNDENDEFAGANF